VTDIFAGLRTNLLEKTAGLPADTFTIRGLWEVRLLFRPNALERTFRYTFVVAQTMGQGACYAPENTVLPEEWMGADAREVIGEKSAQSIAVLDAMYDTLPKSPAARFVLQGDSMAKTGERTQILLDECSRLLEAHPTGHAPRVVNVGVLGNLLEGLTRQGCTVAATDFDPEIVGTTINGVPIEHGSVTNERVRESDLAVITGMTLATDTLEEIMEAAAEGGTRVLIFAETGANFGEEYCRSFGVDAVVSEHFPFYIFAGTSVVEVYRKG
jgi:hypothetical protein